MNGVVLALPKVPLALSGTIAGSTRTLVLVRALCVESVRDLVLVVRVHEVKIGSGAAMSIRLIPVAPTCEDPARDFAASSVLGEAAVVSASSLVRAACVAALPTHVQLVVVATQGSLLVAITATVSIELIGRQ